MLCESLKLCWGKGETSKRLAAEIRRFRGREMCQVYLPISMKNITSTIESTTNNETSSEVLFLKATLYGTCRNGTQKRKQRTWINMMFTALELSSFIAISTNANRVTTNCNTRSSVIKMENELRCIHNAQAHERLELIKHPWVCAVCLAGPGPLPAYFCVPMNPNRSQFEWNNINCVWLWALRCVSVCDAVHVARHLFQVENLIFKNSLAFEIASERPESWPRTHSSIRLPVFALFAWLLGGLFRTYDYPNAISDETKNFSFFFVSPACESNLQMCNALPRSSI